LDPTELGEGEEEGMAVVAVVAVMTQEEKGDLQRSL
jgi:hypothetical protein